MSPENHATRLFRQGLDTVSIAKRLGMSEADASRLLASAREKRRAAGYPTDRTRCGTYPRRGRA